MTNVNRHIKHSYDSVLMNIASGVTVNMGDLMFLNNTSNLLNNGSSSADYYAYPLENLRASGASISVNKTYVKSRFLGVALDDVDGINDNEVKKISVATSGKFLFDLKPAKTISEGDMFSPSGTTTASDMFNQKISKTDDSAIAIGYFAERKLHALSAYVILKTAFSNTGII